MKHQIAFENAVDRPDADHEVVKTISIEHATLCVDGSLDDTGLIYVSLAAAGASR